MYSLWNIGIPMLWEDVSLKVISDTILETSNTMEYFTVVPPLVDGIFNNFQM